MRRDVGRIFGEYLVTAARTGDRLAQQQLVEHWQKRLQAYAYRLTGDIEMTRDVVQEAWISIFKGLPNLQDSATFPAWAYRIVTRRAADHIRRIQRQRRTSDAFAAEPEPAENTAQAAEIASDTRPLLLAMNDLPLAQKTVVTLHYIEEFSIAEIAAVLEVPAGTIKTRLMHARRKLRSALEGDT